LSRGQLPTVERAECGYQGYIGSNISGEDAMANKLNQPRSTDLVLGGLEGVKKRLASEAVEQKVAALADAFNYGEAGLALVIEVLKEQSSPIQSVAYLLLKGRAEQQVKEALQQYYGEKIKSHELDPERVINAVCVINATYKLQQPLYNLTGCQKLILEGMTDDLEEERELLEEAHKSARDLYNLLNDIADFARIEADKMHLELGEVKLDEVFKDVEEFRVLAQRKNLSLYLEMPNNHNEISLYSNSQKLQQVMSNLLMNAIEYTHYGGIKISTEVIEKKDSVDRWEFLHMVKIEVTDTGIGVPLNKQNNLFKPFFDLDGDGTLIYRPHRILLYNSDRTSRNDGIGIGLALSKSLVKRMGGEINFYNSGEGLGSTVTFTIPMLGSRE
jgi:hypothetical protein